MKLYISKKQASGMLGGIKFELAARVELAQKEVLLKKQISIPLTGRALVINLTIGSLTTGQTFKCDDIGEVLEYEKNVKESCEAFKNYLAVMKNFGGQEVYEY